MLCGDCWHTIQKYHSIFCYKLLCYAKHALNIQSTFWYSKYEAGIHFTNWKLVTYTAWLALQITAHPPSSLFKISTGHRTLQLPFKAAHPNIYNYKNSLSAKNIQILILKSRALGRPRSSTNVSPGAALMLLNIHTHNRKWLKCFQ